MGHIKFKDALHTKWRTDQTNYNHELYAICKEFPGITLKQARKIRMQRKTELKAKRLQQEINDIKEG